MSAYKPQCPCTIGKTIVVHGLVTTRHLLYKTLKKYTLNWCGVKTRLNMLPILLHLVYLF